MVPLDQAEEFFRKLSSLPEERRAARMYRLPTEAEWEYACRAGTTTPFHFGGVLDGRQANCRGEWPYGTDTEGPDLRRPTTVGSHAPNAFGLFDAHGNVLEWCADRYNRHYYEVSPMDDPQGPSESSYRVCRGGSWGDHAGTCRSACRSRGEPADCFIDLGFRVAVADIAGAEATPPDTAEKTGREIAKTQMGDRQLALRHIRTYR